MKRCRRMRECNSIGHRGNFGLSPVTHASHMGEKKRQHRQPAPALKEVAQLSTPVATLNVVLDAFLCEQEQAASLRPSLTPVPPAK